ncbi:YIEGIA family protein [Peribacillus alkalitolerans]|uniref:YIEGIA family protein n=1 Tax=Peribacillus alkalitolerans TaxID=1550385 RepID=UPI0013D45C0C|nr:YIEGIA family protein [Peribacillus alkalitolerans]
MNEYFYPIVFGVITGTLARIFMLRSDYRQYPTYLHGKVIHLAIGFIAAGLGSIVLPAVFEEEFTAITFLALAASQFREVRNMERNTLTELDQYELVKRGSTYIEGIAIAFEGRNYLVIMTSLVCTGGYLIWNVWVGIVAFLLSLIICKKFMTGTHLKDIVEIEYVKPRFEGPGLYVDNIHIMNIGLPDRQKALLEHGMGFILKPKNFNVRSTISNLGQRQAILHDVSTAMGVYRDSGTPSLIPLVKRDLEDGRVAVFVLPQEKDVEQAIRVIGNVPTLENAIRMPSESADRKMKGSGPHGT